MSLVDLENPGGGVLVTRTGPRPVGDTSSSAVFVTDLPKNFHGGDEALHYALGELFGQFGKIKKIELYMDKGILETENFKGEALVAFHPSKHTGTHDKGDPVYDACTEMDSKVRILGHRHWRIHCEAAVWQKEGFDVKARAKKVPCIELANLWEYNPSLPLQHYIDMQEAIRKYAAEHCEGPFVKVEPTAGTATIWCRAAQEAIKFSSLLMKSYFLGRKVVVTLSRKERPRVENLPKVPTGELTMRIPRPETAEIQLPEPSIEELIDAGMLPAVLPAAAAPAPGVSPAGKADAPVAVGPAPAPSAAAPVCGPTFLLREGCKVVLKGLVAKAENNGRKGVIASFLPDLQKYQVRLEDSGNLVKVKESNLEVRIETSEAAVAKSGLEADSDGDADTPMEVDAAAASAQTMAAAMAAGNVPHGPPPAVDPTVDGFTATVCVDPALLPKRETEEEGEGAAPTRRRESSRSRERRQQERLEAAKARLAADKGPRPSWVVQAPAPESAPAGAGGAGAGGKAREPEQTREELAKLPVSKLKELLKEFGKSMRGCIEKRDFVDRLKPPPKA